MLKCYLFAAIIWSCTSYVSAQLCYAQEGYTDDFDGIYKYRTTSNYCYYGQYCCSELDYARCCNNFSNNINTIGTIAGAVVGGLIGLGGLIACIVCFCCFWGTRKRRTGRRVVRSPMATTTAFTVANQNVNPPVSYQTPATNYQYSQNLQYPQQQPGLYNTAYAQDGQYTGGMNPPAATDGKYTGGMNPPAATDGQFTGGINPPAATDGQFTGGINPPAVTPLVDAPRY